MPRKFIMCLEARLIKLADGCRHSVSC